MFWSGGFLVSSAGAFMTTAVIYLLLRSLTLSAECITFTAPISVHLAGMTKREKGC